MFCWITFTIRSVKKKKKQICGHFIISTWRLFPSSDHKRAKLLFRQDTTRKWKNQFMFMSRHHRWCRFIVFIVSPSFFWYIRQEALQLWGLQLGPAACVCIYRSANTKPLPARWLTVTQQVNTDSFTHPSLHTHTNTTITPLCKQMLHICSFKTQKTLLFHFN